MPTITTTVTSACASGVVTTQTTTQATPESVAPKKTLAESIKGLTFDGGRSAQICLCSATTQKGFDAIVGAFQAVNGVVQGTDSYSNIVQTGQFSMTNIFVFGSPEAFYQCEAVFGTLAETKIAIEEGVKLDAHVMGNIPPLQKEKWAVWDNVPGFNIHFDTPSSGVLGKSGGRAAGGDVYGYFGEFTFPDEESFIDVMASTMWGGPWGLSINVHATHNVCFYPGGNKIMFFATFEQAAYLNLLKGMDANPEPVPAMMAAYNSGTGGRCYTFGAGAEIRSGLDKWIEALPTWDIQMDTSIGGIDHDGMSGASLDSFYLTTADRNAAQAKFDSLTAVAKAKGVMSFATVDLGVAGLRMIIVAPNNAAWKAVNDAAAADPTFGEVAIGKAILCQGTLFGEITSEYNNELMGWTQAPHFNFNGPSVYHFHATPYATSDNAIIGQQTVTYPTPEAYEAAMMTMLGLNDIWIAAGISVYDFKASDRSFMRVFIAPTTAAMAACNAAAGERPEEFGSAMEGTTIKTIMWGAETAEQKPLFDVWRSDTFELVCQPLKSGFV